MLDVRYPGIAHCRGNAVVYLRKASVMFAGDLQLSGCTPTFSHGSAIGYEAVLERLRQFGVERIVPGHGLVCAPSVIDDTERYVRWVLRRGGRLGGRPDLLRSSRKTRSR